MNASELPIGILLISSSMFVVLSLLELFPCSNRDGISPRLN
jgi:hypothetical protein